MKIFKNLLIRMNKCLEEKAEFFQLMCTQDLGLEQVSVTKSINIEGLMYEHSLGSLTQDPPNWKNLFAKATQ